VLVDSCIYFTSSGCWFVAASQRSTTTTWQMALWCMAEV